MEFANYWICELWFCYKQMGHEAAIFLCLMRMCAIPMILSLCTLKSDLRLGQTYSILINCDTDLFCLL